MIVHTLLQQLTGTDLAARVKQIAALPCEQLEDIYDDMLQIAEGHSTLVHCMFGCIEHIA